MTKFVAPLNTRPSMLAVHNYGRLLAKRRAKLKAAEAELQRVEGLIDARVPPELITTNLCWMPTLAVAVLKRLDITNVAMLLAVTRNDVEFEPGAGNIVLGALLDVHHWWLRKFTNVQIHRMNSLYFDQRRKQWLAARPQREKEAKARSLAQEYSAVTTSIYKKHEVTQKEITETHSQAVAEVNKIFDGSIHSGPKTKVVGVKQARNVGISVANQVYTSACDKNNLIRDAALLVAKKEYNRAVDEADIE